MKIVLVIVFKIAIDDVRITKGACPEQGNCNFEDATLCEYRNMEGTDLKWFARKGYGPNTIYTGPDYDHTYGNSQGYYAIISKHIKIIA